MQNRRGKCMSLFKYIQEEFSETAKEFEIVIKELFPYEVIMYTSKYIVVFLEHEGDVYYRYIERREGDIFIEYNFFNSFLKEIVSEESSGNSVQTKIKCTAACLKNNYVEFFKGNMSWKNEYEKIYLEKGTQDITNDVMFKGSMVWRLRDEELIDYNNLSLYLKNQNTFTVKDVGTFATGYLEIGNVKVGDEVKVVRYGSVIYKTKVTLIEHKRQLVNAAQKGQNVGLCLEGMSLEKLWVGDEIVKVKESSIFRKLMRKQLKDANEQQRAENRGKLIRNFLIC